MQLYFPKGRGEGGAKSGVAAPQEASCILLKCDLLLIDHLAHVDEGVAHPAEGRIDGNAGKLGDFLEAHVCVVTQDDNFALLGWQGIHEVTNAVVRLAADHVRLGIALGALKYIEDVEGLRLANLRAALVTAEGINTHVVADAHGPLQELAFVVVLAAAQGINDLDEHLLEDVLSLAVVFGEKVNAGVDFLLVAAKEFLERAVFTSKVLCDQVLIIQRLKVHN